MSMSNEDKDHFHVDRKVLLFFSISCKMNFLGEINFREYSAEDKVEKVEKTEGKDNEQGSSFSNLEFMGITTGEQMFSPSIQKKNCFSCLASQHK